MTSTVNVHMAICDRTSTVSVTTDGKHFLAHVETPCCDVKGFVEGLGPISMEDLVDKEASQVFKRMRKAEYCPDCLVPSGLLMAAWAEAGLLSASRIRKVPMSYVEFVFDDGVQS